MSDLHSNMEEVLKKVSDLKVLFEFGGKIVPILENLTQFLDETVPLLESINDSILESTIRMPEAATQIDNVTSATELATTEILDLVDEITDKIGNAKNILIDSNTKTNAVIIESKDHYKDLFKLIEKLKNIVLENSEAVKLVDELISSFMEYEEIEETQKILTEVEEASYKITLSLQVQDITSQQLAAVNHLIIAVHERLDNLLNVIDKSSVEKGVSFSEKKLQSGQHFDADATYSKDEDKQKDVDSIVEEQQQKASQEEIDKLFS